ncbi:evolutionarily conserved signaling intermediate in Toll pathway, mitochondrial [Euwallacea fornicatus]|uniref:evolutionarily conserved signaling intermediate in Toll pathway, mitochondrial n=1 Tax=Euwallacea fornicatus TaxID=995702 RepID=UPI00338F6943
MILKRLFQQAALLFKSSNQHSSVQYILQRNIHISSKGYKDSESKSDRALTTRDPFEEIRDKNKDTYLQLINIFMKQEQVYRRGHVEFIYKALKHMQEFGVQGDLDVYRALIDVLPKGKFVPQNIIQAEFMHYPKQQQCILELLSQMEENHVLPDFDMEDQLVAIFGRRGFPVRKYWRMMYWMPKWRYASPFPLPDPLPNDAYELAKLAIERISNIDTKNQVTIYHTADIKDSVDDTWIISAQSVVQKGLLSENSVKDAVFVEGPLTVFLRGNFINYFILRGKARQYDDSYEDPDNIKTIKASFFNFKPPIKNVLKAIPSVHEQEDGVIYALCATGTSSKDSLLSWIRHLELDGNPALTELSIVFKLKSMTKEVTHVDKQQGNLEVEKQSIEDT